MAAGLRALLASADLLDVIIEVRDARMPRSTSVVHLHPKLRAKPLIVLLNREELAVTDATAQWIAALSTSGLQTFSGIGTRAASLGPLRTALLRFRARRSKVRAAVVGAPNTGKSSVINALVRRKRTVTENKAGVTRHVRWVALSETTDLLDTPGLLQPKIPNATVAWQLALCGILPESAVDAETVVARLSAWLVEHPTQRGNIPTLETFATERGMLRSKGALDLANAARAFVASFRSGAFGRHTFELARERDTS
jgi:ribosome biogenesis GTPase A